jgi:hypothetical protein
LAHAQRREAARDYTNTALKQLRGLYKPTTRRILDDMG